MRRIAYISGSRADYGIARRLLLAIQADPDFELSVLATAMHLDPIHGETWREIESDGLTIADKVGGRVDGDSLAAMSSSVGNYLSGLSEALSKLQPEIVLVLGDRGEELAGAMAAAYQNILVAHLCGGSESGSIDDSIRHAITKFSHLHFPSSEEHAHRILQMGEDPDSVHVVGLPGANLKEDINLTREEVCQRLDLAEDRPYLLVIQHSVTHSQSDAAFQITETLEAVLASGYPVLLANPNDDAGGRAILARMQEYAGRHDDLRILPPPGNRELFASIMGHAAVLVGNSSSAVAEAMSVPVPVVNIGDRQRGREHLACWINVEHDRNAIQRGIQKATQDGKYQERLLSFQSTIVRRNTNDMVLDFLRSAQLEKAAAPKRFHIAGNTGQTLRRGPC